MAKDSNKRRVLDRRKQELDHALRHGFSSEKVRVRAEKLRAAVLAVLKKTRFVQFTGTQNTSRYDALRSRWEALSVEEILEVSAGWGARPTHRDIEGVGLRSGGQLKQESDQ